MGVALLSKYSFVFVLFPMVIAGLTTKDLRARLCTPQILINIVVIDVMNIPHYYWYFYDTAGAYSAEIIHLYVDLSAIYLSDVEGAVVRCPCNCCLFSPVYSYCAASILETRAQSWPYEFKCIQANRCN